MAKARALWTGLLPLAALLSLLCAAGPSLATPPAPKDELPRWLLGGWTAVEVHQEDAALYVEGEDPQHEKIAPPNPGIKHL